MSHTAEAAGAKAAVADFARLFAEMRSVGQAVTAQSASVAQHGDALGAITARLAALERQRGWTSPSR